MNKYLNIIIVSFCVLLTSKFGLGLSLFIPSICFFVFNNKKSLFLIIPISGISVYFFNFEMLLPYAIFLIAILIYSLLLNSKRNLLLDSIFVLIFNILSLVLVVTEIDINTFLIYLMYSFVGMILYVYYHFNNSTNNRKHFVSFAYIEAVMAILSVIGASQIIVESFNIGLIIAVFYAMYLSQNKYVSHSLLFSLLTMFYFKFILNLEEGIIVPFVASFYLFPKIYGTIALISFSILALYIEQTFFSNEVLLATGIVALFFEVFKSQFINIDTDKKTIIKNVYETTVGNLNNEIIGFASFLDMFAKNYSTPKEYEIKMSGGINSLIKNYCDSCYKRDECFKNNKGKIYGYFKELIMYSKRSDLEKLNPDSHIFYRACPMIVEMRKSSIILNEKLNINDSYNKLNTLIYQINGVSNVLRQYTVDNSLKIEIDYDVFYDLKKALCDSGFNLCFFEVKKVLTNDFLIEIGLRNASYLEVKERIEIIANNYFTNKVSAIYNFSKPSKTYINLVPKVNFEVVYGYGKIAEEEHAVCGDNYLVKQLNNSKLVAAISDGMGKGYQANKDSNETIKLIDEITNMSVSATTSLQILNTFYFIQDYLEKYSTLDFVEIDRSLGEVLFYKMGAASSYIFHENGEFEKIENDHLPFGIEEMIDVKTVKMQDQDLIIMASDGIFENVINEEELEKYIRQIKHQPPQNIAYEIIKYAQNNLVKANDDMSVIALKINAATS